MNKIYGFEGEVKSKLSDTFVELFAEVFYCLPLAHVINKKVFVVHGGLFSVDGVNISDIRAIDRFCEPPEEGKVQCSDIIPHSCVSSGLHCPIFKKFIFWSFFLAFVML